MEDAGKTEVSRKHRMKHKWSPFQLLASAAVLLGIFELVSIARMQADPGLGGLAPFTYIVFAFAIFIIDIFLQQVLKKNKKSFYISEAILVVGFIIWIISLGGL